jgi:methionine sulfoxide reductase heme-binding subunit
LHPPPATTERRLPVIRPCSRCGNAAARALHALVWLLALLPLALLLVDAAAGRLGANPIEALTRRTGKTALVLLVATLAITPLRRLSGWNTLIRMRRPLGVFAFVYAALHMLTYVALDHFFDWRVLVEDVAKRPFITSGFAALVLLAPLAATSTRGMIRRLGRRWQPLHRLVYPAALLAVLHYFWNAKADTREPLLYAGVVIVLLGARLALAARRLRAAAAKSEVSGDAGVPAR